MTLMIENIQNSPVVKNTILELDRCVGFFLMQFLYLLEPETTYIIVDYDLNRLQSLKKELEQSTDHENFVFLCCDYNKLPLADQTVNCIVDAGICCTTSNTSEGIPLSYISKKLAENGIIVGLRRDAASEAVDPFAGELKQLGFSDYKTTVLSPETQETEVYDTRVVYSCILGSTQESNR